MGGIDCPAIPISDAQSRLQCVKAMQPELFGLEPLPMGEIPRGLNVAFPEHRSCVAHCGIGVETNEGLRVLHCPEAACGVVPDSIPELALRGYSGHGPRLQRQRIFPPTDPPGPRDTCVPHPHTGNAHATGQSRWVGV